MIAPVPACRMCGHPHERDCTEKIPGGSTCGCELWAEGWKPSPPPACNEPGCGTRPHTHGQVSAIAQPVRPSPPPELAVAGRERMSDEEWEHLSKHVTDFYDESEETYRIWTEARRAREAEAENADEVSQLCRNMTKLADEVARLREALEEISLMYHADTCQHVRNGPEYMCACHVDAARAALRGAEEKP